MYTKVELESKLVGNKPRMFNTMVVTDYWAKHQNHLEYFVQLFDYTTRIKFTGHIAQHYK